MISEEEKRKKLEEKIKREKIREEKKEKNREKNRDHSRRNMMVDYPFKNFNFSLTIDYKKICALMNMSEEELKEFMFGTNQDPHQMQKYSMTMKVNELADSFVLPIDEIIEMFTSGKESANVMERYCSKIYKFIKSKNRNAKYDGYFEVDSSLTSKVTIGIKCLTTHGVSFSSSALNQNPTLWEKSWAICGMINTNFQIVCDIIDFPKIYFIPVNPMLVVCHTFSDKITNYTQRDQFYPLFTGLSLEQLISNGFIKDFDINILKGL